MRRYVKGAFVPARRLVTVSDGPVAIPDPDRIVHLQLRRFAGCPFCSLHLRAFVERKDEIAAAGVREVVVFHSTVEELREWGGDLPFAVVCDPDQRLYAELGVRKSVRSLIHPHTWAAMARIARHRFADVEAGKSERIRREMPHGGGFGLPAELLIGRDGRVLACKYGEHAYDQWSVEELLALVRAPRDLPPPSWRDAPPSSREAPPSSTC